MPNCCIVQCSSRKRFNQPELTFHRMPRNETLRKKWIDIIGAKNINPRQKDLFVCSLHFEESCFNRTLGVVRLHENIVPLAPPLLADKQRQSALCESSNVQQEHIAAVIPPLQNVEIAIQKMRNSERIKKLTSTCIQERKKLKRLTDTLRTKNKEIALLENIVEDLKKTYNGPSLHLEECPGSQDSRKKLIDKSRGLVHSTVITGDVTWVTTGTL